MTDPYSVLGISPSASQDEITQAYRKLAKKYHPDINPGNKEAERKMREINAAYEQIKSQQNGGASYERADGSYGPRRQYDSQTSQGFGGFEDIFGDFFGGGWNQRQNADYAAMQAIRNYIINRQYQQAIQMLSEITDRDALWHYYSAVSNAGIGNRVTALGHAREAVRMEPGNPEYQSLLQRLERSSFTYQQTGSNHGFNMRTVGRTAMQIIMAQLFCIFCCRPCC